VGEEQHVIDILHEAHQLLSKWKQFCSKTVAYQAPLPTLSSRLPKMVELGF
jgi:hypothetical protein